MTIIILVPRSNQKQPLIAFHIFISSWGFMSQNATVNIRMCFSYEFLFMAMQFSGLVRNPKGWKWSSVGPELLFSRVFPSQYVFFSWQFFIYSKSKGKWAVISYLLCLPRASSSPLTSPTLNVSCWQLILLLFLSLLVKLNLCSLHVYFPLSLSFVYGGSIILMV